MNSGISLSRNTVLILYNIKYKIFLIKFFNFSTLLIYIYR